jgi:hypothetical protein
MTSTPVEAKGGGWEDFLEIFYAPSKVFARRGTSWGMPLLVLVIVSTILVLGTRGLLGPLFEQDGARAMADRLRQMTPEQAAQAQKFGGRMSMIVPIFMIAATAVLPIVIGVVLWLVGKMFGAVEELGAALMVAVFSYFPRALAWAVMGLQAAILPEEKLKGMAGVSLSPARFLDPTHTSLGTMALAARFDVFVIWTTILLVLGLKVTGKISTEKAVLAGVVMWLLGSIQPLIQMLRG